MLFLLLSVLFYSINNLLWKQSLKIAQPWFLMVGRASITTFFGVVILLVFYNESLCTLTIQQVLYVNAAAVSGAVGLAFMLSALKKGGLVLFGIYTLLGIFLTAIYLMLVEGFSVLNYARGGLLVLLGYILYLWENRSVQTNAPSVATHLKFMGMVVFFTASGIVHWYNLTANVPPLYLVVNQEFMVFIFGLTGYLILEHKKKTQPVCVSIQQVAKKLLVMSLVVFLAVLTGFLGLHKTDPLVAALIALGTPVLTMLFGLFILKEKRSIKTVAALVLIITGAFMLQWHL